MVIFYEPKNGNFTLKYSLVNKYLTSSSGEIVPHSNNAEIKSPRFAHQKWTVQAPSNKLINMFVRFVDLVKDNACSPASLSFVEANGQVRDNLCGDLYKPDSSLDQLLLFTSNTSEISVLFKTQDSSDVVYHGDKQIYQGFQVFYAFVENRGDCYFHKFSDLFCGYLVENWEIKKAKRESDSDYEKFFCPNCLASAFIPSISSSPIPNKKPQLISPTIAKNNRFLRLKYKVGRAAHLNIYFVYDTEYREDNSTKGSLLFKLNQSLQLKTVMLKIIPTMYDFRIRFQLDGESAEIKSIEFFEEESECILDNECELLESELTNHGSYQKKPCERNQCSKGSLCLNTHDDFKCICGFGYTGKYCEKRIDPCETIEFNKCSKNSKCVPSVLNGDSLIIDNNHQSHMK